MDGEDAKQHDFDQRHDGPFDAPRASMQLTAEQRHGFSSSPAGHKKTSRAPSAPVGRKSMQEPRRNNAQAIKDARRSLQQPRHTSDPMLTTRGSMQLNRATGAARQSRDFDNRRDGPYGRPSITMVRRRSSGTPLSPESRRPTQGQLDKAFNEKDRDERQGHEHAQEGLDPIQTDTEVPVFELPMFEPEPPPLHYSLAPRKWSIIMFWSLILVDCIAMPIALYFGLWYGLTRAQLSANAVFSIVTAALGGVSILEYVLRFRRLWRKSSTCRPIGARRAYLDWFHWNFSLGWVIVVVELIIGTIPENPPIRLLSMPVVSMLYAFGTQLLVFDVLRLFQVPAPVRVSSIPKGSQLRPCIYALIEDICAVDGSGGTTFRENLNRRYEASHIFRAMLRRLGVFWAIGSEGAAVVFTILIFTIQHEAAYCVGWAAPFVWGAVWSLLTYWYVKYMLKKERQAWAEEVALKAEEGLRSSNSETGVPLGPMESEQHRRNEEREAAREGST
ncbi:hypothetical protein EJ03DRAFT_326972 [Teratosphaeria nubilosa]|uniref:Uncharacterized protein n=1 Tax=Teratosphaeria nubilosa TaxID=161662 RepID=A0A6G1LB56_9PEZI|nr:hypothetical protein EJ03DRAFT_326972 [Teratosphaeria nubilosa]